MMILLAGCHWLGLSLHTPIIMDKLTLILEGNKVGRWMMGKRAECVNDGGCSATIHTMDIMMIVR
jgi:anaerobic ribonucleoside-triphosphate reductase